MPIEVVAGNLDCQCIVTVFCTSGCKREHNFYGFVAINRFKKMVCIGRIIRLTERWPSSTILLRYISQWCCPLYQSARYTYFHSPFTWQCISLNLQLLP